MDYSKTPLHKRTRLQEALFFKRFDEEKKKAKHNSGGQLSESGSVGRRENGDRGENSSGRGAATASGTSHLSSVSVFGGAQRKRVNRRRKVRKEPEVVIIGERDSNTREEPSVRSLNYGRSQINRKETIKETEKGSKGAKNRVYLKKNSKSIRDLKRKENVGSVKRRELKRVSRKQETDIEIDNDVDDVDERDEEIEFVGEVSHSNGCCSRTGVKSKERSERERSPDLIDDEAVHVPRLRKDKGNGVKVHGGKAQTQFRGSKENKNTYQDVSEELLKSSSSEEDDDDSEDDYKADDVDDQDCSHSSDDSSPCDKEEEEEEEEEEGEKVGEQENSEDEVVIVGTDEIDEAKEIEKGTLDSVTRKKYKTLWVVDQRTHYVDEKKGRGIGETRSADGEETKRRKEGGVKKRRIHGLDFFVDDSDRDAGADDGPKTTRRRLRPRSVSKSRNKKLKLGTIIHPLPVDEEFDSSSEEEEDDNSSGDNGDDNDVENAKRSGGKGGKVSVKLLRRRKGMEDSDFVKILADSIWEEGDRILEKLVPPEENNQVPEPIPLKFWFEDENSGSPEKPEWQEEVDNLFAEMEMAKRCCEIGSTNPPTVKVDETISTETDTDPATLCSQGSHQLILYDEVGIICKLCSFVQLESKYILPSFSKNPGERRYKRDWGKADHSSFDELELENSSFKDRDNCKSCLHAKGTVWDLIPGTKGSLYSHQQEGFEFIWKNIAGDIHLKNLKRPLSSEGSGCIISHAPGTGKSRLTIVFLQALLQIYPNCLPVIIAPRSMLLTWKDEFQKWMVNMPFHNMNDLDLSGEEDTTAVNFMKLLENLGRSKDLIRMLKLYSWKKGRSILGISYKLFEKLAGEGQKKGKVQRSRLDEQIRKMLLELPGLLVLDEGHTPRNDQSQIWKALSKIETQRRIILSGTPFQNNFTELYNTLWLVNPRFADTIPSKNCGCFGNKRGQKRNEARGKWASLTSCIGSNDDVELRQLRAMIDPFVHVHKGTILQESLPGLRDSVIVLKPTDLQKRLLQCIPGTRNQETINWLEIERLLSLISVHPSLLIKSNLSENDEFSVYRGKVQKLKLDPNAGVKTKFLVEFIGLSEALKEKVLVFSQFIDPLIFVKEQLESCFNWTEGREVLYMDGQCDAKQRHSSISSLNDPTSEVRVLLASTRACSEGINLVGASRVVLLDVVWNPSVERQAISRAYRLGQKKVVYIYHLITSGTMECEKHLRQAEKDRLSQLIFSSVEGKRHKSEVSSTVSEDKILEAMVQRDKLGYIFEKILEKNSVSEAAIT